MSDGVPTPGHLYDPEETTFETKLLLIDLLHFSAAARGLGCSGTSAGFLHFTGPTTKLPSPPSRLNLLLQRFTLPPSPGSGPLDPSSARLFASTPGAHVGFSGNGSPRKRNPAFAVPKGTPPYLNVSAHVCR